MAAFDSSATWRGYTAARRRRPNAASGERAAMRMEDEDPPTHTYVNYHLYDGSQPEGWYSTPNDWSMLVWCRLCLCVPRNEASGRWRGVHCLR